MLFELLEKKLLVQQFKKQMRGFSKNKETVFWV
jgi:hypothetical protein